MNQMHLPEDQSSPHKFSAPPEVSALDQTTTDPSPSLDSPASPCRQELSCAVRQAQLLQPCIQFSKRSPAYSEQNSSSVTKCNEGSDHDSNGPSPEPKDALQMPHPYASAAYSRLEELFENMFTRLQCMQVIFFFSKYRDLLITF